MVVLATTNPLTAQSSAALEFMGFRPGMSSADVQARVSALGGKWSCSLSKVDSRFSECRATINADAGGQFQLIGSVVGGTTAILLISGEVEDSALTRWVDDLSAKYGKVTARLANTQAMWQWVRARRMIRITTRIERSNRVASVSLVDGITLDSLGGG
ncbi:MAG TPA: hypothetical protein VJU15_14600 [Gemmatimonadales bacterium]|nr:hypothetical protein [Gemmatimonadales bacterium]